MDLFKKIKRETRRLFQSKQTRSLRADPRPRILFVSHEATRTGAPMIALNLVKHFAHFADVRLTTILHNGGHLVPEFIKYSHVECLNLPRKSSPELQKRIHRIVTRKDVALPKLAICNSMESRFVAYELAALGVPIIFLIHELPSSYPNDEYARVFSISDQVVFPAQTVLDETSRRIDIALDKTHVFPQGLLNPEFGCTVEVERAREQLREELGIPPESNVVLGCGTLDLRKGIDHFIHIARETLVNRRSEKPTHFLWLGDGPRWTHSPFHYIQLDLNKMGIQSNVHFLGERESVEPYFVGSDLFLLTSRVDPFPCVIHEAMAARLPIISFDQSGGAPEAIADGGGMIVPYGDHRRAAEMIDLLLDHPAVSETLKTRSHQRVQTQFRFTDYGDRILELAEQVARTPLRFDQPVVLPFAA